MIRAVVVVAVLATTAQADPLDELGTGAASTGMAGARTALAIGAEAAHDNPANVSRATSPELILGYQYSLEHLQLDGRDAGVVDAHGTTLALAIPFAIAGVQLGIGAAAYLPDQYLARIQLAPIGQPQFVRFASANQRVVVEPVASVSFGELAVGAGASLLANARSNRLTFEVGVDSGSTHGQADLDIELPLRVAPVVGVWWRPRPWLELAGTFRGELSLDVALDVRANVDVPDVISGDAIVTLRSVSYFTPMRGTVAAAVHATGDLVVTAEATWEHWSALGSGVPSLDVLVALDLAPPLVSSQAHPASFSDIVTTRVGAEWTPGDTWRLRAGLGYLPSPVPAQTGVTSFADGRRILGSIGAGVQIKPGAVLTRPLDLDLALAWQHVDHQLVVKDVALDPGGAFSSGGDIVQASISTTVRF